MKLLNLPQVTEQEAAFILGGLDRLSNAALIKGKKKEAEEIEALKSKLESWIELQIP